MKWPGTKPFFKKLFHCWKDDSVPDTAAALSFYGMLALFPFLLFVVSLVGLVLDPQSMRSLVDQLAAVAPPQVTTILSAQLDSLLKGPHTSILTVGAVAAIWAASGGISALMQSLNRCYDIRETRPFWKSRLVAIGATFVAGIGSVLAVAVTFAVPLIAAFFSDYFGGWLGTLINYARWPVAGGVLLLMWAFFYWALPNVRPRFQLVSAGSLIGVALWLLASWGFSEYVRHFGKYEATYGALGGMIVLLLWMWISAMVLLLGAEINKILTPAEKLKRSPTGEATGTGKTPAPAARPKQTPKEREPQPA